MTDILGFFKEIFMLQKDDGIKVGLSQFKQQKQIEEPVKKDVSIRTKDVKLSDLMRRAG